jgi:curved DNA-binding protein CbpA
MLIIMSQSEQTNYYEILEVTPDAAATEIHKAYQRARQTYSQDNPALYSMFSPDEARELLRLIDEAYNVLGNQATRKSYDESLSSGRGASSGKGAPGTSSASPNSPPPLLQQQKPHHVSTPMSAAYSQAPATLSMTPASRPAAPYSESNRSPNTPPPVSVQGTSSSFNPDSTDDFSVKRRELQRASVPTGQGRTSLSTFKLDDSFEAEISAATEFDGGFIQRVRLYKNISIDKMSESTRISRSYLMAVETNDYKSLPAAVFVRGFVVQVARQLGLDDSKVASSYMKLFKAGGGK